MIEGLIVGILEQGLIYGIMAMGVYITYTILDFPDLSVDGTFPLGIAICFVMINNGLNPWLALLAAFAAGCIAGMFTGIFNVKLRIRNLLCGILTMTALYSINYGIVGKASDFLSMDTTTIFSQTAFLFGNGHFALYSKLEITLAQNPGTIKIIGLAIANGLVSLAGAVYCQYGKAFNVASGTGTVVMGLAAVIIGSTIFKKIKFLRITTGVLFGMIIYKACISIALAAGLRSQDTNLMITILFIATLCVDEFLLKKKKVGVKKNA